MKLHLSLQQLFPWTAALGLLYSTGCADVEEINPVETSSTTSSTTTTIPEPEPSAVTPKRTVFHRNPLGDPANNLLVDGDFELSISAGGGQYGWRKFNSSGTSEIAMTAETGGLCRTGLTCARFKKGEIMFGRGTAAAFNKGHVMSVYARVPEGIACQKVNVIALECDTFKALKVSATEPELENGFCHYKDTFAPSSAAVCLYLTNTLPQDVIAIVDSAVLAPNDGTVPYQYVPEPDLPSETKLEMQNVRDLIVRTTVVGAPQLAPLTPHSKSSQ